MVRSCEIRTVEAVVWVTILSLIGPAALGRELKMTIHPQKVSPEASKYVLLPPASSLTDGDAVPWYEKAVKALPDKSKDDQVWQWLKMPIDQLPADQVEQVLTRYLESFKCVAQAVKCRQCNWPAWTPGTQVPNLDEYRRLAFGVRLWVRLELSNGQYDGALLALQTGFGMGRQLGQAPTVVQMLVGVATANVLCREIEQLTQMEDAPNLYSSLANLPKPFLDAQKVVESEKKAAASSGLVGGLVAKQAETVTKPVYERALAMEKRLESDLAILQCVEAIRSYAASHGGQLPQTLAEITEVSVPKDPMCGAAFRYTRTGATAVLESTAPAGGEKKDETRYEITVKK